MGEIMVKPTLAVCDCGFKLTIDHVIDSERDEFAKHFTFKCPRCGRIKKVTYRLI